MYIVFASLSIPLLLLVFLEPSAGLIIRKTPSNQQKQIQYQSTHSYQTLTMSAGTETMKSLERRNAILSLAFPGSDYGIVLRNDEIIDGVMKGSVNINLYFPI